MTGRKPPWSDLPQELLSAIANFLTSNPISIFTFRSICHSWRSSCPPLSNSPLLSPLLPLSIPLSPNSYNPFYDSSRCSYLSVTIIYALHRPLGFSSLSPDTWILFADEFTPVQDLGSCGNDCILFTTDSFLSYSWNDDDYMDFPKFKKGDLNIGVYHLHNADDFGAIESYPGYPDTLWPPPCWIWSIDRLKRIEIVETAINEIIHRIPENFKAEVNSAGDSCDDFGKSVVLEFTRGILMLSKMAITFQEEETEFMNKLRETMDFLNQVDNLLELARTRSPWAAEGRLGWPDAFKDGQACHGRLLLSTLDMLRSRYAHLLYMEERATQMEMSMNSEIVPMLT